MNLKRIHLWCPNLFEFKGGIQAYSRFLLKALQITLPDTNVRVFSMHDRGPETGEFRSDKTSFSFAGRWPRSIRKLAFATKLFWGALLDRPELIISSHLHFSPLQLLISKVMGTPYWVVAHGVDAWEITSPLIRLALREAEKVIAVSHYTRDRIIQEHAIDPSKVQILANTFDENRFQLRPKPEDLATQLSLACNDKVLLTVCRFDSSEKYKGYDQVLASIQQIKSSTPHLRYILVGKGSDLERVTALIDELGLSKIVTIAGEVPDDVLPAYFNLCDLFVMPSKGEGFGIVFLEALASGKPCIAGNCDGAREPLQDGTLGLLVDPDDIDSLSEQILSVLNATHFNQTLFQPQFLRARTVQQFGFESFCKQLSMLVSQR